MRLARERHTRRVRQGPRVASAPESRATYAPGSSNRPYGAVQLQVRAAHKMSDTEKTLMPKAVQPQKYFKIAAVACSKSQAKQMTTRKGMLHYAGAQQCALQQT
ncbi:MAG: hypothetical protein FRX49_07668 [Trebouxia sp. A1-2]|nr:MAG: hypothetical protein FRX49_07668 [Trebouxia sp. A1-2]